MVTIAELRARNGKMSQRDLAKEIGTTQTSISLWEKDIDSISSTYLKKLCLYFNVSSDELLGIATRNKKIYTRHDLKSYTKEGVR